MCLCMRDDIFYKNALAVLFVNRHHIFKKVKFHKCLFVVLKWGGQLSLIKSNRSSVDRTFFRSFFRLLLLNVGL